MSTDHRRHELRIGDAERDAAVSALGEHYAAGRLTTQEYDERADRAWAARTGSDLASLFEDLPEEGRGKQPGPHDHPRTEGSVSRLSGRFAVPWFPLVLAVVVVVAFGHLWPILLIAGLVWCTGGLRRGRLRPSCHAWSHHRV